MSATGSEPETDLERMLTASLHERAATIVTTRPYLVPDRIAAHGPRRPVMRYRLLGAGLAVAVVAVGVVIRVEHNGSAGKSAGPQQCVRSVPNDFAALVAANRIPGTTGTVVSGYSDGTLLLAAADNRSLDVVDSKGHTTRIWTATGDEEATVDPQAAMNNYAVVFAVGPAHSNPTSIDVYRLDENRLETLATTAPNAPILAVAPITLNDTGYWVTGTSAGNQQIAYFELEDQTSTPDSTGVVPAHAVTQLLAVGGVLGWVQDAASGSAQLGFYPAAQIPSSVIPDSRAGSSFTSDRTTVAWLTNSGDQHIYWTWSPGDPNPTSKRLTWKQKAPGLIGSFLTAAAPKNAVLDSSTGTTFDLSATMRLVAIYGNDAVLTTAQAGATAAISRVALADLALAHC